MNSLIIHRKIVDVDYHDWGLTEGQKTRLDARKKLFKRNTGRDPTDSEINKLRSKIINKNL